MKPNAKVGILYQNDEFGRDFMNSFKAALAAADRRVWVRPALDCMAYVTALLPVAQGVAVFAALTRAADSARAGGDSRSRGQVAQTPGARLFIALLGPAAFLMTRRMLMLSAGALGAAIVAGAPGRGDRR